MTGDGRLRVDVLGPIRAVDGAGRDVTPDGALQRRLLALLVLRRGHVVSVDAAVEALWPSEAPRDPVAALQNQVSRLRRRLPAGVIESVAVGYRLDPARVDVDADRLADALRGAAGPDLLATLDDVLARWQGPAYPELDEVDDGRAETARLAELRLRAREEQAACRLAAGALDEAIVALAALVDDEPLRERPRSLLMAALAAAGRRAEALRQFDDYRRRLADELGIEPSPALAAQHADVLAGSDLGPTTLTTRLPVPVASLLGREALADEVADTVTAHRLVTLVGPGGVGKTRLAIEVGHRLRARREERPVVLCELATTDGDSAIQAVATALGVDARPGVDHVDRVVGVVGDREVAVLLDNCEHVLEPVAELVERLLGSCPSALVLATSRERLRVPGERVCTVPTLAAGDADAPAVQLFVERARAVAPDFAPDPPELATIADLVRRLDGLPLAIELAAARVLTHDVAEIAAGLDRRFTLLASGSRTSPRHGSLHAAMSWSLALVDERLRRTFTELSVFCEPFTAADAAAVCAIDEAAVTVELAHLAERSLVQRAPGRRWTLLETLRAFAAEQIAADGRTDEVARRHAHHQVEWAEDADRRLLAVGTGVIAAIDAAVPELRAALGWLLERGELDLAGRLAAALKDYGFMRQRPDVLAWCEQVLQAGGPPDPRAAALVCSGAAYAAWMAGDATTTSERGRQALRLAEEAGGPMPAEVATIAGSVALFEGDPRAAVRWYRQVVDLAGDDDAQRLIAASTEVLARAYGDDPSATDLAESVLAEVAGTTTPYAAYAWYCAGEADLRGDVERSRARLTHALHLAELTGASLVTGVAGASRASIDARLGDPEAAAADYQRLIDHMRAAGAWSTQWTMLRSIAVLLERLGRPYDSAVLAAAIRATSAGTRIFGADEVALAELDRRLRGELGEDAYEAAAREGAVLDGDAAVEHALRALTP